MYARHLATLVILMYHMWFSDPIGDKIFLCMWSYNLWIHMRFVTPKWWSLWTLTMTSDSTFHFLHLSISEVAISLSQLTWEICFNSQILSKYSFFTLTTLLTYAWVAAPYKLWNFKIPNDLKSSLSWYHTLVEICEIMQKDSRHFSKLKTFIYSKLSYIKKLGKTQDKQIIFGHTMN